MQPIVSLSAIQYELGESHKIDGLDFLSNDPAKLALFTTSGLANYRRSTVPILDLSFKALTKTLDELPVDKNDIDVLLFVCENANRDYSINIRLVNNLMQELGLVNALPVGIALSDCANILTGLQMATAQVASGMANNVLLVCADIVSQAPGKREMAQQMSVLSDGALSCFVSAPGKGDYDITGIIHKNKPSQWEMWRQANENAYSLEKLKHLITVSKIFLKQQGLRPKDFIKIMTGNYRKNIAEMFVEFAGFTKEQAFFDNIANFGHTLAGDVMINLKDYASQTPIHKDERVFMLVDSYSSCGSVLLQKT